MVSEARVESVLISESTQDSNDRACNKFVMHYEGTMDWHCLYLIALARGWTATHPLPSNHLWYLFGIQTL